MRVYNSIIDKWDSVVSGKNHRTELHHGKVKSKMSNSNKVGVQYGSHSILLRIDKELYNNVVVGNILSFIIPNGDIRNAYALEKIDKYYPDAKSNLVVGINED